ncbi:guanine nucleotide exchange factor vps9 [Trichoderma cornu-damae]|uniref:Guanine nucleotide exchange factor vps9 n=1 Tax=Trichoderma cornu-damae TaxID=654480 RepID=A0A9P8QU52_9HYPO|nr:guanine nucleotide exchange factor vps9 [Trichoderma cornu-damae]
MSPPEAPASPPVPGDSRSTHASEATGTQDPSAGLVPAAGKLTTTTHAATNADAGGAEADADVDADAEPREPSAVDESHDDNDDDSAGTRAMTTATPSPGLDADDGAHRGADGDAYTAIDTPTDTSAAGLANTDSSVTTTTSSSSAAAAAEAAAAPPPLLPLGAATAGMASDEGPSGRPTNAELGQGSGSAARETRGAMPGAASPSAASPSAASPSASTTTKPPNASPSSPPSPMQPDYPTTVLLAPELPGYVDPTPPTPMASRPPSRAPSATARTHRSDDDASPTRSNPESDDKPYASDDDHQGSQSEIQSIMEQFSEYGGGPDADEVMSPRLEIASPMLGTSLQHPPRKSSLEPLSPSLASQLQGLNALHISTPSDDDHGPPVPPKDGSMGTPPRSGDTRPPPNVAASPASPTMPMHRPPPPDPEPEPALPFDFHRFLEQLRNKKADPVARYLKSFLFEFGKRQWMVHEQVKIISDFLAFIANKMMLCEVWRDVTDAEFDNAREGMEKLVMNRLYTQTFSPAIPPPKPIPGAKPRRRGGDPPLGPGRRGQHQEDVERDDIVTQKINIYGWVKEDHLDIPQVGESGRRFLKLAQQGEAPRDKIICVLNCCKVIFGLLKHNKSDSSADSFMPLLIYVVLQSNPEHLVSNVQYILRFRNQEKLGGEAGYYLSSLMGAVQFIENMDRTSLTITDDEFEKNVEAAVSAIAEKHQAMSPKAPQQQQQQIFNEKSLYADARPSTDGAGSSTPRRSTDLNETDNITAPISGLLRTIQNPLTTIGRMFSDDGASSSTARRPPPPPIGRPLGFPDSVPIRLSGEDPRDGGHRPDSRYALPAEEAAARQASAEVAEAQRLHRAEHANVVETLAGMFPDLDKEVISDVVYQKEGSSRTI